MTVTSTSSSVASAVRRHFLVGVGMLFLLSLSQVAFASEEEGNANSNSNSTTEETYHHEEEADPSYAVLFPSFITTLGVFVFYFLSRYLPFLPYTAVMFILGTFIGLGVSLGVRDSHIHQTVVDWQNINSEVLLLVFLPGLIFKDAMGQNVYLFWTAMVQMIIFAFPCVLAGTVLTALVGYYVFPYGWSFNLAMTFGSILSATDPVAVAALLEEVGAPPRLMTHISGEALLNDGAAIVFFAIFSEKFFYELMIPGFGEEVDLAEGVKLFCQKALGGTAIGIVFGFGILCVLYILDRRFSREENVVQVTAVVSMAYLNYYVSDFIAKTSGVIATVAAGLIVRFAARALIVSDSSWCGQEYGCGCGYLGHLGLTFSCARCLERYPFDGRFLRPARTHLEHDLVLPRRAGVGWGDCGESARWSLGSKGLGVSDIAVRCSARHSCSIVLRDISNHKTHRIEHQPGRNSFPDLWRSSWCPWYCSGSRP